jgi:hypothetical protein
LYLFQTQHSPIIGVFWHYTYHYTGKLFILNPKCNISAPLWTLFHQHGVKQCLETLDCYIISLSIHFGQHSVDMSRPIQKELEISFFNAVTKWIAQDIIDEYYNTELVLADEDLENFYYQTEGMSNYVELILSNPPHDVPSNQSSRTLIPFLLTLVLSLDYVYKEL